MNKHLATLTIAALTLLGNVATTFAQTTAFTFQGQLTSGAGNANGSYDLRFAVYDANVAGNFITGPVTNSAVAVSNGLFTVTLDFGAGVFTGTNYWVEMGVRTNGGGSFATLVPRQPLTPTPYALYAAQASQATNALSLSASAPQFNSLCPPGSIMAYVGTSAPSGWLMCDGAPYSATTFAVLYAVIGNAYGAGGGQFNVPDMRGVFMRGSDNGRGYDLGRVHGSYQADMFASHDHASQLFNNGKYLVDSLGSNTPRLGYDVTENNATAAPVRTDPTGGSETRPKNVSVNYIIKY